MTEIPLYNPNIENEKKEELPILKLQEENNEQKLEQEKTKKRTGLSNASRLIGNLYHKKIDTSLYKKVFFNNFKELCLTLFPQYKNFSNEKYLNFKNIYHKIYHATKDLREATETAKNEFQNLGKKANEIRKINHKNNIIRLIIQKLEGQPFKPKDNNIFKQIAEEFSKEIKPDAIEKIYDSVDITEIKNFDEDKLLSLFLQRTLPKQTNKKRTRKQMEKERSQVSPQEYLLNSETSPEIPQKCPMKKQKISSHKKKSIVPEKEKIPIITKDIILAKPSKHSPSHSYHREKKNSSFYEMQNTIESQMKYETNSVNLPNPLHQSREKILREDYQKYQNFWMSFDIPKNKYSYRNTLANFVDNNSDMNADFFDQNETNTIKMSNRNILGKLNKFCSYDFTQTNELIPHIYISNEKTGQMISSLRQENSEPKLEFYKKHSKNVFRPNLINPYGQIIENPKNPNIIPNGFSEEGFNGNFMMNGHMNLPNFNYSEPQIYQMNQENLMKSYNNHHSSNPSHHHHRHHHHSKHSHHHHSHHKHEDSGKKIPSNHSNHENMNNNYSLNHQAKPNKINSLPIVTHDFSAPSKDHGKSMKSSSKNHKSSKKKSRNYTEKELEKLLQNEKMQAHSNFPLNFSQPKEKNENNYNGVNNNIPPFMGNNFTKTEAPPYSQQQRLQMYNIMSVEKELSVSRRPCNIPQQPQIYQPQYRSNAFFFNNGPENNYMNNNMNQSNLYCYPQNNNSFIGVNYPNIQNISFAKPNNYSSFAVVDMGTDNNNQFGMNYMQDRAYSEKSKKSNEYWKPPYYPYNNQN